MVKRFEQRVSDFGHSDVPAPPDSRWTEIMINNEVWRVELEGGEEDTPELRAILEDQANIWGQIAGVLHGGLLDRALRRKEDEKL